MASCARNSVGPSTTTLAHSEQQIAAPSLRFLERGDAFDPAWAQLGVIHPERRVEAFYAAVEQLVLPRLAELGIDAQRAWTNRYRV